MRKLLLALEAAGEIPDFSTLILCGRAADALHNAPDMLLNYAAASEREIERGLSRLRRGVPRNLWSVAHEILDSELSLPDIDACYNLAPAEEFGRQLQVLKHVLVCARNRWCWDWSAAELNPRTGAKDTAAEPSGPSMESPSDVEDAAWWGRIASVVSAVPEGLVHWNGFDEEQLRYEARSLTAEMPPRILGYSRLWLQLLHPAIS